MISNIHTATCLVVAYILIQIRGLWIDRTGYLIFDHYSFFFFFFFFKCVCMRVCVCVCVYLCLCACVRVYLCLCAHMCVSFVIWRVLVCTSVKDWMWIKVHASISKGMKLKALCFYLSIDMGREDCTNTLNTEIKILSHDRDLIS